MYLLDTSVISHLVNPYCAGHEKSKAFMEQALANSQKCQLCVITLAEMELGFHLAKLKEPPLDPAKLEEVKRRVNEARNLQPLEITSHVASEHALLKALWAKKIAPNRLNNGKLKGVPPEKWYENWAASELRITENDLWIAAVAIAHKLRLITADRDFTGLKSARDALVFTRL